MRKTERRRKQRVVLRERRRSVLAQQAKRIATLLGVLVCIGVVLQFAALRRGSWMANFVQRHTPEVQFEAPEALVQLALKSDLPEQRFWLWLPGTQRKLSARWLRTYPAAGSVRFDRHFIENRVVVHIEPRVPLVRWQDNGIDKEGKVFPLAQNQWPALPKANLADAASVLQFGPWVAQMVRAPGLWATVVAVTEDKRGELSLDTQRGTHIVWGAMDAHGADKKARYLAWVLDDAHQRLGGAALADVRFFDEGRIVVRPKTIANLGSEG